MKAFTRKFSLPGSRMAKFVITGLLVTLIPWQMSTASVQGARISAATIFVKLKQRGYSLRDFFSSGLLRRGQSTVIATTLSAGNSYTLVAAGCEDAYDVDLAVYDENGNRIGSDGDSSAVAVVSVTPRWTGTYYLKVTMYNSTSNGAHYVLQYAFK
jgi:hypothetical protein